MKKLFLAALLATFFNTLFSSCDKKNDILTVVQNKKKTPDSSFVFVEEDLNVDSSFFIVNENLDDEIIDLNQDEVVVSKTKIVVIDKEGISTIAVKEKSEEDLSLSCYDILMGYVTFFTDCLNESLPNDNHKKE